MAGIANEIIWVEEGPAEDTYGETSAQSNSFLFTEGDTALYTDKVVYLNNRFGLGEEMG